MRQTFCDGTACAMRSCMHSTRAYRDATQLQRALGGHRVAGKRKRASSRCHYGRGPIGTKGQWKKHMLTQLLRKKHVDPFQSTPYAKPLSLQHCFRMNFSHKTFQIAQCLLLTHSDSRCVFRISAYSATRKALLARQIISGGNENQAMLSAKCKIVA